MSPVSFTRDEALDILHALKWMLSDERQSALAGFIEDVEMRLVRLRIDELPGYADLLLPPGHRGRVQLCLSNPYTARVEALVVGLLRSIRE